MVNHHAKFHNLNYSLWKLLVEINLENLHWKSWITQLNLLPYSNIGHEIYWISLYLYFLFWAFCCLNIYECVYFLWNLQLFSIFSESAKKCRAWQTALHFVCLLFPKRKICQKNSYKFSLFVYVNLNIFHCVLHIFQVYCLLCIVSQYQEYKAGRGCNRRTPNEAELQAVSK